MNLRHRFYRAFACALLLGYGAVDAQPLRIGGDYAYPPYEFLDGQGRAAGFNIELMRTLGRIGGFTPQFILSPWAQARQRFAEGQLDVLPVFQGEGYSPFPHMLHSDPFQTVYYEVFARMGTNPIQGWNDLRGKRVVVQQQAAADDFLQTRSEWRIRRLATDNEMAALRLVMRQDYDYAVVSHHTGVFARQQYGWPLVGISPPILPRNYVFAVSHDHPALRDLLNRSLAQARAQGELERLQQRWFPQLPLNGHKTQIAQSRWLLLAILGSIGLLSVWAWSLRFVQRRQTQKMVSPAISNNSSIPLDYYQRIVDTAQEGIWLVDAQLRTRFANYRLQELLGYSALELAQLSVGDVIVATDRPRLENYLARRRQGFSDKYDTCFIHKHGQPVWVIVSASPLLDDHGAYLGSLAMLTDISARKLAEQSLQQAAAIIEATREAVMVANAQGILVRVNPAFCHITGFADYEALGQVATSLLRAPELPRGILATLQKQLEQEGNWQGEVLLRRRDGSRFTAWMNVSVLCTANGEIHEYVIVFADISALKHTQHQLDYLAHHDPLTHLPNRLLFNLRLAQAVQRAQQQAHHVALLFLDMDRFKNVNDTLGHHVGDDLLLAIADRLRAVATPYHATVARLGGDEFTLLVEGIHTAEALHELAGAILHEFSRPFELHQRQLFITPSIGISRYPIDGESASELLRNADAAMYRAKDQGRNSYEFYTPALTEAAYERLTLETQLRYAIERNELLLHYQPQVRLSDHTLIGAEALVRWRHPQQGMISPVKFIPVAEESGLIDALGDWVLRETCRQLRQWSQAGLEIVKIAVNLSSRQVTKPELVERIGALLHEQEISPHWLQLELTESAVMSQAEKAIVNMQGLKALGLSLAIDDFGTGYSSINYLKRFPVDKLKVDRSFVCDIPNDPDDEAIARAIIVLGHSLGLTVVAEGVETTAQKDFLHANGCDEIQGFWFSRPLPAPEFAQLLAQHRPLHSPRATEPEPASPRH